MSWASDAFGEAGDVTNNMQGAANAFGSRFGTPGKNSFKATPAPVDPANFQNPYLTGGAGTAGSQANLEGDIANLGPNAGYNAAQAGYGNLAGRLEGVASGAPGTSVSQQILAGNVAKNNANAMGMASSMSGVDPALAMRTGMNAAGTNNMEAANTAAAAGILERNAANAELGNVYGAQGQLGLGESGQENSARENYTGMAMGAQQNQLQANENYAGLTSGNYNAAQGLNAGISQGNAQNNANLFGGAMAGAGSLISNLVPHLAGGGVTGDEGIGEAMQAFGNVYRGMPAQSGGSSSSGSAPTPAASVMPQFGDAAGGSLGDLGVGDLPIAAVAARGAVVPGVDHHVDTKPYMLRPNEVVTPPENPIHPFVKKAQLDPAYAAALAHHLGRFRAAEGVVVPTPAAAAIPEAMSRGPIAPAPASALPPNAPIVDRLGAVPLDPARVAAMRHFRSASGPIYTNRAAENSGVGG